MRKETVRVDIDGEFIDTTCTLNIVIGAQVSEGDDGQCAVVVNDATGEIRHITDDALVKAIADLADGQEPQQVDISQIDEAINMVINIHSMIYDPADPRSPEADLANLERSLRAMRQTMRTRVEPDSCDGCGETFGEYDGRYHKHCG